MNHNIIETDYEFIVSVSDTTEYPVMCGTCWIVDKIDSKSSTRSSKPLNQAQNRSKKRSRGTVILAKAFLECRTSSPMSGKSKTVRYPFCSGTLFLAKTRPHVRFEPANIRRLLQANSIQAWKYKDPNQWHSMEPGENILSDGQIAEEKSIIRGGNLARAVNIRGGTYALVSKQRRWTLISQKSPFALILPVLVANPKCGLCAHFDHSEGRCGLVQAARFPVIYCSRACEEFKLSKHFYSEQITLAPSYEPAIWA